jgi:cysteine desulfurase / selenocysteine lyase
MPDDLRPPGGHDALRSGPADGALLGTSAPDVALVARLAQGVYAALSGGQAFSPMPAGAGAMDALKGASGAAPATAAALDPLQASAVAAPTAAWAEARTMQVPTPPPHSLAAPPTTGSLGPVPGIAGLPFDLERLRDLVPPHLGFPEGTAGTSAMSPFAAAQQPAARQHPPAATPVPAFDVAAVRRDFPALQQRVNGHPLVWLDNAATSQKPRAVIDAVSSFYERDNSNVHRTAHTLARRATEAYEGARRTVQRYLGARGPEEVVFVRGTTEAINLVAQSYGRAHVQPGDEIVVTELEHHANIVPWQMLAQERGARLQVVPITDAGEVDVEAYARLLGPRTRIVALSHASNVLGTVLPIEVMTRMAHCHAARVLIDGAQSVPHFRPNVQAIDCDFYVFSGHKLFGPTGVGVLYGKADVLRAMPPWQGGGNMIDSVSFESTTYADIPHKFEAGTAILAGAVGLGRAIDYLDRIGFDRLARYEHALLAYATKALSALPGITLIGTAPHKVAVLSFVVHGARPEDVATHLDRDGIAVRAGHHCAQPTMRRYGVTGMVRASLAFYNTVADVDALIASLRRFVRGGRG